MRLVYKDKDIKLIKCSSFFSRLKGFMFCRVIDKALMFDKCNSIHTFFMYNNIDVIMCDNNNIIKFYYNNLSKNNVILPKRGVSIIYETPCNYFNIKIGDKMEVRK